MRKIYLCVLLCFLLSGCYTVVNENEYGRHVKGLGVDITIYPVFAIRVGLFEYQLFFQKDKQ